MAANPGCSVRSHCHEVECTVLGISVVLSVESCQDPVQLTLRVPFSDSEKGDTQTFYVTQEEEQRCNWQGIMVIFSRNTTHLHFYVSLSVCVCVWGGGGRDPKRPAVSTLVCCHSHKALKLIEPH